MKCQFCDAALPEGATACLACGAPVSPAAQPEPSPANWSSDLPDPHIHEEAPRAEPAPQAPPPPVYATIPTVDGDKVLGMESQTAGVVSLVLGIVSLVFACASSGCGGFFGVPGLVLGWMTLKTQSRQLGMWGVILNGLALLGVIIAICLVVLMIVGGVALGGAGGRFR